MKRRLYQLTIIVVSLFIIHGLSRNLGQMWQQRERVRRMKRELLQLSQQELDLRRELNYYRSDEYVEKIAREKLLLGKEGETVIMLPEELRSGDDASFFVDNIEIERKEYAPNWKKWARLFGVNLSLSSSPADGEQQQFPGEDDLQ